MAPLLYIETSYVGLITIICGWVLAAFAMLAVTIEIRDKIVKISTIGVNGLCLILATTISIVLTIVTTWAVLDEGQGEHMEEENAMEIALVAKVSCSKPEYKRR